MKFKKLFLFIILGILFSLNITSVRADNDCKCYKITDKSDKTVEYTAFNIYDENEAYLVEEISDTSKCSDFERCVGRINYSDETKKCVDNPDGSRTCQIDTGDNKVIESDVKKNESDNEQSATGNKQNQNQFNNYDKNNVVSCGNGLISDIPNLLPKTIHIIYLIIQILVPIILVIFGSIDFVKSVIASKDDEINKGRQIFIKRLIYGVIVFFVFSIVKLLISLVGDKDNKVNIMNCASCLINNDSNCVVGES